MLCWTVFTLSVSVKPAQKLKLRKWAFLLLLTHRSLSEVLRPKLRGKHSIREDRYFTYMDQWPTVYGYIDSEHRLGTCFAFIKIPYYYNLILTFHYAFILALCSHWCPPPDQNISNNPTVNCFIATPIANSMDVTSLTDRKSFGSFRSAVGSSSFKRFWKSKKNISTPNFELRFSETCFWQYKLSFKKIKKYRKHTLLH